MVKNTGINIGKVDVSMRISREHGLADQSESDDELTARIEKNLMVVVNAAEQERLAVRSTKTRVGLYRGATTMPQCRRPGLTRTELLEARQLISTGLNHHARRSSQPLVSREAGDLGGVMDGSAQRAEEAQALTAASQKPAASFYSVTSA